MLATLTTAIHMRGGSKRQARPRQEEDCSQNRAPFEEAMAHKLPRQYFVYKTFSQKSSIFLIF
jgi:hypothetical protein